MSLRNVCHPVREHLYIYTMEKEIVAFQACVTALRGLTTAQQQKALRLLAVEYPKPKAAVKAAPKSKPKPKK